MWDIFNPRRITINKGKIFNEDIRYTREYYNSVIDKIVKYRIQYDWFLNSKNTLTRLVHRMIDPTGLTDFEYFRIVEDNGYDIARELLLGTRYNKASWYMNNTFKGSRELYYVDFTPIDLTKVPANWRSFEPLEVLYTDNEVFEFTVPDSMVENNITVIYKINIFKLFLQYKYWLASRKMLELDTGINRYIAQYVYPKSLYSYLDYTLWNIYSRLVLNKDYVIQFENNMPFSITDYTKKMKKGMLAYLNKYENTKSSIDQILQGIPAITKDSMYDVLRLADSSFTIQGLWLALLARTEDVYRILLLLGSNGKIANTEYIGGIKRYVRKLKNSGSTLPLNTPPDIKRKIEKDLFRIIYDI